MRPSHHSLITYDAVWVLKDDGVFCAGYNSPNRRTHCGPSSCLTFAQVRRSCFTPIEWGLRSTTSRPRLDCPVVHGCKAAESRPRCLGLAEVHFSRAALLSDAAQPQWLVRGTFTVVARACHYLVCRDVFLRGARRYLLACQTFVRGREDSV